MPKPKKEIIFRCIQGIWTAVTGDSGTLASYLEEHHLLIDKKTHMARLIDFEKGISIWYRNLGTKIVIQIWEI